MVRQCLKGGDYELINKTSTIPNPDYWILWLWTQFIGNHVFEYTFSGTSNSNVRGYAFSGRSNSSGVYMETFSFSFLYFPNKKSPTKKRGIDLTKLKVVGCVDVKNS